MNIDADKLFLREGDAAQRGMVLAPLVRLYVAEGRFPRNTKINLVGGDPDRAPNGWFWPSTHPIMEERQLVLYLTQPERWQPEPWSYEGRMSVTIGSLEHSIVQMALDDLGVLQKPTGTCPACRRPYGPADDECGEPGVVDHALKRRGHLDGVVKTSLGITGLDIKTINHFSVGKIPDDPAGLPAIEWLKTKHPYYYGQMQEYMALSGLRMMIMLFIGMGLPWTMKEIHVEFDPLYVIRLENKYRRVREYAETGYMPNPCCAPQSKESKSCPATSCPIRSL